MKKLLAQVLSASLGLWLATLFVVGVQVRALPDSNFFGISLASTWKVFIFLGIILGLLNYFVKPALDTITLPLRLITLGLFSFVINMFLIWLLDVIFNELYIPLWLPLVWTTLIVFGLNTIISKILIKE